MIGRQISPLFQDDDYSLMQRVVAQDRQAFEVLYQRYARRLYSYLARFLRQPETIEEVFNDVMLAVWQNAARFDPQARLSTWILGIAYRKALKALAQTARQLPEYPPARPEGYSQDDPEIVMLHQERVRTFVQALQTLSPEQRAVVELTFYHGCSYLEIATIAGCPVNTVKTRMFHARRRLAHVLAGFGRRRSAGEREEPT
jgi:RNA polymerase sigma-70 factor (ECF subfamily)